MSLVDLLCDPARLHAYQTSLSQIRIIHRTTRST